MFRTEQKLRPKHVVEAWWSDRWVRDSVDDITHSIVVRHGHEARMLPRSHVQEFGLSIIMRQCSERPFLRSEIIYLAKMLPMDIVHNIRSMIQTIRPGQPCSVKMGQHLFHGMVVAVHASEVVVRYTIARSIEPCYEAFPINSPSIIY